MARQKNDNLLIFGMIGLGVYLLTRKPTSPPPFYNYPQIPPAPPQNTPQWQQWASLIVTTFGNVSSLWMPGGPFYKQPITPAQAIELGSGQQYSQWA